MELERSAEMKDTYNDGYKTEDIKCIIVDFITEDGKGGYPIMRQGTYVLCKDCKYWQEPVEQDGYKYPSQCTRDERAYMEECAILMDADDFCSKGEKR